MSIKFHAMRNGLVEVIVLNDNGLVVEILEFLK